MYEAHSKEGLSTLDVLAEVDECGLGGDGRVGGVWLYVAGFGCSGLVSARWQPPRSQCVGGS